MRRNENFEEEEKGRVNEGIIVLSDEMNDGSEQEGVRREKPGNAQFLETPRVQ
jgi:hypothetical protein